MGVRGLAFALVLRRLPSLALTAALLQLVSPKPAHARERPFSQVGHAPASGPRQPAALADPTAGGPPPASGERAPSSAASPLAELKRSNSRLSKLLSKRSPSWSPEADLQRSEVRKLVGSFLDYRELARRSLARHWDEITAAQREECVSTFGELIERNYLKKVHGSENYDIRFESEEKHGNDATVAGTLVTVARGKKVTMALVYKLLYKDGHWLVYDVIQDDLSMLENYRAEFNRTITKESFDALLKRMKRKLDEKSE